MKRNSSDFSVTFVVLVMVLSACLGLMAGALIGGMIFSSTDTPPVISPVRKEHEEIPGPLASSLSGDVQEIVRTPDIYLASTPTHFFSFAVTLTPTPTPFPTFTATPTPTPTPSIAPDARALLEQMPLSSKVGQLLMVGLGSSKITPVLCQAIGNLRPGGIVYTGVDVDTPEQLRNLSMSIQRCAEQANLPPLFVGIDHEGQYVNRFASGATVFPSAMALGAVDDVQAAYDAALASGQELRYAGVNMVLGPVCDVLLNWDNDVISVRAFGGKPEQVGAYVRAAVQGYNQAGVISVLKHFPGHGGVADDSHTTLPIDKSTMEQIQAQYFPPFEAGIRAGAPVVMTAHVLYSAIDPQWPASLSSSAITLLREDLGFQGVVITDSLGMQGARKVAGDIANAAVQAVRAGADMVLIPASVVSDTVWDVRRRLEVAVLQGEITEERLNEAVLRVLTLKLRWEVGSWPVMDPPNWNAHRDLAYQLGYRSVTLVRDTNSWVPLSPSLHRVLIVGPRDGWGLYPVLQATLAQHGFQSRVYTYSGPWVGQPAPERHLLNVIPSWLRDDYDVALLLTWDAHLTWHKLNDDFQIQLVRRALDVGKPVIVVALKSPVDIVDFPDVPTYLITLGTLPGQIQGLADVLVGVSVAQGQWPLETIGE